MDVGEQCKKEDKALRLKIQEESDSHGTPTRYQSLHGLSLHIWMYPEASESPFPGEASGFRTIPYKARPLRVQRSKQ